MADMNLAQLNPQQLARVRELEEKLGGVCLLAVEKVSALFAVEAKTGPNEWIPAHEAYPEIEGLKSYFHQKQDADTAKAVLKNLLRRPGFYQRKKPIRVRQVQARPEG